MSPVAPKIRLGFVGGGEGAFIGQAHRQAAGLDGGFELVCGAFSRDARNNQQTGAALGLDASRCYSDWRQLVDAEAALPADQRMELLVIVTPNHLHAPIAVQALKAGFDVFSEKPAALNLRELLALKDVLQGGDRLYGLAHTYLGYPMVWQAREMVRAGVIGTVRKVLVEYPQGWLSQDVAGQGNKQAGWRDDPQQSGLGGCIGDIGTHAFSLAEFVTGQHVEQLCAALGTHIPGRQLDDDAAMLLRMSGGVSGVLIASQVCAGEENPLKIRVYGDKGALEWRQEEPSSLIHRALDQPLSILRCGVGQPWLCEAATRRMRLPAGHPEGYLEAMANLYGDFARAIRERTEGPDAPGVPGIETGLRGMAFIEAALINHRGEAKWTALQTGESLL
ncbi:gfo/Idh/MocA family oxidoreductase [Pseudomonas mediterranea]|uniref:Predicted dehydrogenase n=1 Tax=Pseudomonas mediterranea TaxID=183795 RepID=A0AAX2DBU8_9PSED|nr:Gfo/Idh/MocA family oxidoreductase [Pseudomonas mediterranea]KGU86051.1 oxidoreductase [Pseudomonas mediterranea CFBP 5447]MBL0842948.1 Gfo/Idh/MocA family oxidoreductase [Pseudomonas mediterranea]MDU9028609.1 Gfo/Idh/MocA family oxidoreductase [Pseudomonas mediterranea]QHA83358.1 gfo/Idh/MocA family oxidoreductase [Pseudomonas mediterranea]CAH0214656.1 Glucose-6-phosphate 3-dehydrogenase [Pseudomonas mediterranea]